jgi:predicted RNA-binding Zn-ribbon protein involved in translation (DUF1610 family)
MTHNASDRRHFTSVAVSFGHREDLARFGGGVVDLVCPECGAKGTRFGNPGADMRFEGFEPVTRGGLTSIIVRCARCAKEVAVPHRPG